MAAPADVQKVCNVLSPLGAETLQLIRKAPPIAQEPYEADNARFAPLRSQLLALYGDGAAPKPPAPQLLVYANEDREDWLVDECFVLGIIKFMAAARAPPAARPRYPHGGFDGSARNADPQGC